MKKLTTIIGLSLLAAMGAVAQEVPAVTEKVAVKQQPDSGQAMMSALRQAYEQGEYDALLADLDQQFAQWASSDQYDEFLLMREAPPHDQKIDALAAQWEETHLKLLDERNAQLLEACKGSSDTLLCEQVASVASQMSNEQRDALKYLASLRFKTPDQAASEDERTLILIDLASEFKLLTLDGQYVQKPFEDRTQKNIVIKMDMLKQMEVASASFTDASLVKKLKHALAGYDTWQARNWDLNKLNSAVKKPKSDTEKKVAAILSSYHAQKEDLYQKEFLAKLDDPSAFERS